MLKKLQIALLVVVGGPLLIFVMLLPRLPSTPLGWWIELGGSAVMCLGMLIAGSTIAWLQRQHRHKLLFKAAVVLAALMPGGAMIYFLGSHSQFIAENFR